MSPAQPIGTAQSARSHTELVEDARERGTLGLRHVRCVLAVAEHLHFSQAADALDMAAPSLTRTIQEAERLLGARLFDRTKRSVELTAAGSAYIEQARVALDHLARAEEAARAAQRGELGRIEIGYVSSAVYSGVLQQTVGDFRATHARVEISVREVPMERVGALLEDGQIDLAYFRPPMPLSESITTIAILEDAFVLAVPADSAFASLGEVNPTQLRGESFVVPEQPFGVEEVGRRGRFAPHIIGRSGTLTSVLARVSLGGCVTVVPNALARSLALPGVVYVRVAGKPITTNIAIASRKRDRAPAVRAFLARWAKR